MGRLILALVVVVGIMFAVMGCREETAEQPKAAKGSETKTEGSAPKAEKEKAKEGSETKPAEGSKPKEEAKPAEKKEGSEKKSEGSGSK